MQLSLKSLEELTKLCTREIQLWRPKRKTLVSNEDYIPLSTYTWAAYQNRRGGKFYVLTTHFGAKVYMHHLILSSIPQGYERDHIDRNTFNNTRGNLRFVTRKENALNNGNELSGIYPYKNRFQVYLTINNTSCYIGTYRTLEKAKEARDNAR